MKTAVVQAELTRDDNRADDVIIFNEKNAVALFMNAILDLNDANRTISILDAQLKMARARMERLTKGRTR